MRYDRASLAAAIVEVAIGAEIAAGAIAEVVATMIIRSSRRKIVRCTSLNRRSTWTTRRR